MAKSHKNNICIRTFLFQKISKGCTFIYYYVYLGFNSCFWKYFFNSLLKECFVTLIAYRRSDRNKCFIPTSIYGKTLSRNEALKKLGLIADQQYLLFFGFIRDYKGLDLLFKALAEPILDSLNLKLIVAGEFYGDRKKYMDLIEELGINDKVILHSDFIPDEKVKNYFCAADLLVQTYKTATQSGIAQIAYHFGLPMVVTNVGGLPEIVIDGQSGYVVEVDPSKIAAAIFNYFDQNKEEEFRKGTLELKERFSWRNLARGFLK